MIIPTAALKGGTLIYIDNKLRCKTQNDVKLCKERDIESTFLEIIESNTNKIVGCVYEHLNLPVSEYLQMITWIYFLRLTREKKNIILKVDFNIDILNCDSNKDTADFVDTIYASLLYSTINTPTQIRATSKTLVDNTFYNDFIEKMTAGNIASSISDYLTQFVITRDHATSVEDNRKKEVPKFENLIRFLNRSCKNRLEYKDNITLKYIKMMQTYPLSCFLET